MQERNHCLLGWIGDIDPTKATSLHLVEERPEVGSTARNQIEVKELVADLKPVRFAFLDVYRGTGGLLDTRANEACLQDATAHAESPFDPIDSVRTFIAERAGA